LSERTPHISIRIPKKLLFSAVIVVMLFGVFEIGQRVSDWRKAAKRSASTYTIRAETWDGTPVTDKPGALVLTMHPHLVFTMKPNQRLTGLSINAQGFRGRDWVKEKPPGTVRLAVLGGSAAFGHSALSDEATMTAVLERQLNRGTREGARYEVMNAGVMAYDSRQEFILLATEILDYDVDLVLVFDGWNDFYQSGAVAPDRPLFRALFGEYEEVIARSRQPIRAFLRHSAFYRGLERRLSELPGPDRQFGQYGMREDALAAYRKNLRLMCRIARAAGARGLLVSQPELYHRPDPVPEGDLATRKKKAVAGYADYARACYPRYMAAAREAAAAEGASYYDANRALAGHPEAVFSDRVHLNDDGQRIVGKALAPVALKALERGR